MLCKWGSSLMLSSLVRDTDSSWWGYSLGDANHGYGGSAFNSSAICWHVWSARKSQQSGKENTIRYTSSLNTTPFLWGFIFLFQEEVTEILIIAVCMKTLLLATANYRWQCPDRVNLKPNVCWQKSLFSWPLGIWNSLRLSCSGVAQCYNVRSDYC